MNALCLFVANLPSIAAVAAAGWLAVNDKTGWGWFLIVALLCHSDTIKFVGRAAGVGPKPPPDREGVPAGRKDPLPHLNAWRDN